VVLLKREQRTPKFEILSPRGTSDAEWGNERFVQRIPSNNKSDTTFVY
jgi:hypothetical protein